MKTVEFYRGECSNCNGDMLIDILQWTDDRLEVDHDWVQWVFPSNERSKMNDDAPTMTREESQIFINDPELREKVKQSLVRVLKFLQFKLKRDDQQIIIVPTESVPWWLHAFNHTMLRVTRILKCLRLTGNSQYANALFNALRPFKDRVSANTWKYWHNAVFEPLWEN